MNDDDRPAEFTCGRCHKTKHVSEFTRMRNRGKRGHKTTCRDCRREQDFLLRGDRNNRVALRACGRDATYPMTTYPLNPERMDGYAVVTRTPDQMGRAVPIFALWPTQIRQP